LVGPSPFKIAIDGLSTCGVRSASIQRQPSQGSKTKSGTQMNLSFFINIDGALEQSGLRLSKDAAKGPDPHDFCRFSNQFPECE
jgi:hypothetical protein